MSQCSKCGAELQNGAKFCMKCGTPCAGIPVKNKSIPQRPQPLVANGPQRPQMPQTPQGPTRPQMPQAPQVPSGTNKGFFTDAVRTVANAVTLGGLNRDIERERAAAVRDQAQADRTLLQDAEQSEREAIRAQIQAEREAERARDQRAMDAVDGVDVVRGRAIWNIQPGEIARRISERELEEVEKLKGIIVQEGCTAIIFVNGELVSTLSSGAYLFYKSVEEEKAAIKAEIEKAEKELQEKEQKEKEKKENSKPTFRQLGIVGEIGRAVSWVGRLIFGEKKNERKEKVQKRKVDYARILAKVGQAPVMSVYLVSDRYITLTFGGLPNEAGGISFEPYTIPIGIHDVEVGVSLQMKINDIPAFATNYLADRSSVTVSMVQQMLTGTVEALLRQTLRNSTYDQTGLPADVVSMLKQQIMQTINHQVYGIACTQVLNITDSNQDFERFRSVERELYNTEKELDFMHRTGEFRNRMENEANLQQINSAQNEEQLRYALQQINKDQLLHDDELEEFTQLLYSQARIRQAKTETEEFEAMEDLRKNRLVKEDEMEALADALMHNKIPREEITQIMRIQSQLKIDTERMHAEWALSDSQTDHDWEREDLERRRNWGIEDEEREREWIREEQEYNRDFDRMVKEDDYDFQKMMRKRELQKEEEQLAYERARQDKFDEDQLDANRSQRQIERIQAMAQVQAQMDAQKYQHEENLATLNANERMNRDNNFANMTAEQIRAAQLDRLSESGQVAMANAYGSEKEAEFLRQQAERQHEDAQRDKAQMMDFAKEMAAMVRDTATSNNYSQQQRINEMQQEAQRQQQRFDQANQTAMNNIAQVSTAAASNVNAFGTPHHTPQTAPQPMPQAAPLPQMIECQCYNCGQTIHIPQGTPYCPNCGAPFQW